jgi:Fibronectin type III domain
VTFEFPGDLVIILHSPAELLITNSSGRSTGLDPITNTNFKDIANAVYVDESITDITDTSDSPAEGSSKQLVLQPPAPDTYTLTVTGTDSGTYDLEFRALDPSLQKTFAEVNEVPTFPGVVHKYQLTTPVVPGQPFPLSGSFNGGGQNRFLSFASPTRQATLVAAGQNNFPVIVFYGNTINANSFNASLNGQSLTSLFHPAPGAFEIVNIPLPNGLSTLTLQISGTAGGQTATDTDALQFNVGGSAPNAPTGLTATTVTDTQINLAWTASTSSGVTYTVFRSTTSGFTPSPSNQIAAGLTQTTFSDNALTASTTYFYLVEAVDAFAASAASNQASATTQTPGSCSGVASTITANFNGTAIPSGDSIWFSSVAKASGLGSKPVTIFVRKSTITFTANGIPFTVAVPDANLTFDPTTTVATTTFDAPNNLWRTVVPSSGLAGNVFLNGAELRLPNGLPGGIKNVMWTATFSTDTPGVTFNWQWAAAAYTSLGASCGNTGPDFNDLDVKPVDDNKASEFKNSDHAGTPEDYKASLVGGATGGGGSNFTGSYSGTKSVTPILVNSCGANPQPPTCQ